MQIKKLRRAGLRSCIDVFLDQKPRTGFSYDKNAQGMLHMYMAIIILFASMLVFMKIGPFKTKNCL